MYSDTVCRVVTACSSSQFRVAPATAVTDAVCRNLTVCGPQQYQSVPPTDVSDRACQDLTVCSRKSSNILFIQSGLGVFFLFRMLTLQPAPRRLLHPAPLATDNAERALLAPRVP